MTTLDRIPFETQKKIFKRLADLADSRCLSKEEMEKYEESQNVVDNYNLGMASAWMEGKMEVARNLFKTGMTFDKVMQVTGLTQEQIKGLQK